MYMAGTKSHDALSDRELWEYNKPEDCPAEDYESKITADGETVLNDVKSVCGDVAIIFKSNWMTTQLNLTTSERIMDLECRSKETKKWYSSYGE